LIVKPKDFPVGTILEGSGGTKLVRLNETQIGYLDYKFVTFNKGNVQSSFWREDYHEITTEDLNQYELKRYRTWFPEESVQQACTCELMSLMAHGCTCGWIEKERVTS